MLMMLAGASTCRARVESIHQLMLMMLAGASTVTRDALADANDARLGCLPQGMWAKTTAADAPAARWS